MSTKSFPSPAASARSAVRVASACGAALVGLVLVLYSVYIVPNKLADSAPSMAGFLVFLAIVGLLSIAAAIGYWTKKTWGWYIHLPSVLGQLLLPGSLFEFKPDAYHMVGWLSPALSLVIAILMGVETRRQKRV